MDANTSELVLQREVFEVVGSAIEVNLLFWLALLGLLLGGGADVATLNLIVVGGLV